MKKCLHCGKKSESWEANCVFCKKPFVEGVGDPVDMGESLWLASQSQRARPDGQAMATAGSVLLVLGIIALIVGWMLPASEYAFRELDLDRISLKLNLMFFGSVAAQIGGLAFFSAKIIEALSFLPGRGENAP